MKGSTREFRNFMRAIAYIETGNFAVSQVAPVLAEIPGLTGQAITSGSTFFANFRNPDALTREQLARILIMSVSLAQIGLIACLFFTHVNCEVDDVNSVCMSLFFISAIKAGLTVVIAGANEMHKRSFPEEKLIEDKNIQRGFAHITGRDVEGPDSELPNGFSFTAV